MDETSIKCVPPSSIKSDKGLQAGFTKVFDQGSTQSIVFEDICRPMVNKALNGQSGLLFNYGVTCSGKTYTMTGSPQTPGFLPRSLDMIFASIDGKQTNPFQIQSDDNNGFRLLSQAEAMAHRLEKRNDIVSSRLAMSRARLDSSPSYNIDEHYMEDLPAAFRYAVFMSYIDIYNEQIYDLLEDLPRGQKPRSKRIRDNADRGVYANATVIKEVRTLDEALKLYEKGLKQRRNAETSLNLTSSRSHAILTIHIVRLPIDVKTGLPFDNQSIDLTKNASLLHLVDLAGSERQNRTKAQVNISVT